MVKRKRGNNNFSTGDNDALFVISDNGGAGNLATGGDVEEANPIALTDLSTDLHKPIATPNTDVIQTSLFEDY